MSAGHATTVLMLGRCTIDHHGMDCACLLHDARSQLSSVTALFMHACVHMASTAPLTH